MTEQIYTSQSVEYEKQYHLYNMKYELIKTDISTERTVMQDIIENNNVVGQESTDEYEVTITIGLHSIDGIAPDFSKDIIVRHNNHQTGFEVDIQREQEITNFLNYVNDGNK